MADPNENLPFQSDPKRRKREPEETEDIRRATAQNRTLRACEYCRKQKTRCFKSSEVSVSCLRCLGSNKVCSLEIEYKEHNPGVRLIQGVPEHLIDKHTGAPLSFPINLVPGPELYFQRRSVEHETRQKVDAIYSGVLEILGMMKGKNEGWSQGILNSDAKLFLDVANTMKRSSIPGTPLYLEQAQAQASSRYGIQSGVGTPAGHHRLDEEPDDDSPTTFVSPAFSFKTSPFFIIANNLNEIPQPIVNLLNLSTVDRGTRKRFFEVDHDIISSGIFTESETIDLMNDFRSNYGRWVLFALSVSTDLLIMQIRKKSSLLLTTCCCLSLRYLLNNKPSPGDVDSHRRKKDTYKLLMRQLVRDLDKSLLKYASFQGSSDNSGDIEFLQAIVILSIYLLSLSSIVTNAVDEDSLLEEDLNLRELNLDPWYLSGIGLTTFISKATFGTLFQPSGSKNGEGYASPNFTILYDLLDSNEYQTLTIIRIYNHLILIHLVSCVFSGRMCVVDGIRLNLCNSALDLPSATNFDGRMVSEIGILLIAYNYIQVNLNAPLGSMAQVDANLQTVKEEIASWHDQWVYLFSQPALQFVEFCYDFCYILIYYSYGYTKIMLASKIGTKMGAFLDIYNNKESIDAVLEFCDKESIVQMFAHAYHLVQFILTIENDSYFAYLSDQIHFCFYFGALVLIRILRFLKENDKLHYLNVIQDPKGVSESNWKVVFESVNLLIDKYDVVAQDNRDDIITKYKNGLIECMEQLFPSLLSH